MRPLLALALAAVCAAPALAQAPTPPADPYIWLEEVDGPRALAWVEAENKRTLARLEADARYQPMQREALAIFTAKDRIANPEFRGVSVDNIWQDETHSHGIWRTVTPTSYRSAAPAWRTLIDLDALSMAEGKSWFWKGADCLRPAETICLVNLSNGGGDAVVVREFDTAAGKFVEGGFSLPEGKSSADWLDRDTLVVGRDWSDGKDPNALTESGYAYVLKEVKRGRPLSEARELFRGERGDVSVQPMVFRGEGGRTDALIAARAVSFFETEYHLLGGAAPVKLPLPLKTESRTYVAGQWVFTIQQDWKGFKSGALLAYDLAALKRDPAATKPVLVFRPGPRQAIQTVGSTDGKLIVHLLEDVKGAIDVYSLAGGAWSARRLPVPADSTVHLVSLSSDDDRLFFSTESFLAPTTLWLADAAAGTTAKVAALPARFNGETHVLEQLWATSSDGTKIPYFVVRPKNAPMDGSTPTLMYGYGGFENAKPPIYIPEAGKLWMERGGAYVIANIRGGSEFGPAWHQSVLRDKRQLSFDDFAAVARDLAARKITSARRLGIYGRSNGGVLTSVSMTQHPELWNAVVIESPLIDMLRYHKLSAGASWTGEYGNPDVPEDYAFIARYSAYQNLKPGQAYPEPYITTNTRDDRVHPGHARKFAAKLKAMGYPYLYYENTFGGHSNDADPEMTARRWALHYVYLAQKLMD